MSTQRAWESLSGELRTYAAELAEVLSHIVQSQNVGEFELENFRDALTKTNGVRLALQNAAAELDERGAT